MKRVFARLFGATKIKEELEGIGREVTDATKEFVFTAIVESMVLAVLPITDRDACWMKIYSNDPIVVNGETEHHFQFCIPNYSTDARFNSTRMRFWLCYRHLQPVLLDEYARPYVPLIDEESCDYFTNRMLPFKGKMVQVGDGHEVFEIDFVPQD